MLSESVKEAWHINTQINKGMLEHLTPDMLSAQTPADGLSVAHHLAEIVDTPKFFGAKFDEALGQLPTLYKKEAEGFSVDTDLERIKDVAQQTADAILSAAEAAEGKGDLPQASLDVYLIHMMAHDAHHRGQLMVALKAAGQPLPSDDLIWGTWKRG